MAEQGLQAQLTAFLLGLPVGAKWRYEIWPAGGHGWTHSWLYQKVGVDSHDFINTGTALLANRKTTQMIVYEAMQDAGRCRGQVKVRFVRASDDDKGAPPPEARWPQNKTQLQQERAERRRLEQFACAHLSDAELRSMIRPMPAEHSTPEEVKE